MAEGEGRADEDKETEAVDDSEPCGVSVVAAEMVRVGGAVCTGVPLEPNEAERGAVAVDVKQAVVCADCVRCAVAVAPPTLADAAEGEGVAAAALKDTTGEGET